MATIIYGVENSWKFAGKESGGSNSITIPSTWSELMVTATFLVAGRYYTYSETVTRSAFVNSGVYDLRMGSQDTVISVNVDTTTWSVQLEAVVHPSTNTSQTTIFVSYR